MELGSGEAAGQELTREHVGERSGHILILAGVQFVPEPVDLVLERLLRGLALVLCLLLAELLQLVDGSSSRFSAGSSASMVQPTANCPAIAATVSQCRNLVTTPYPCSPLRRRMAAQHPPGLASH